MARLRSLQERVADRRSEEDEARARRWREAKDREWRQRERAAAERQVRRGATSAAPSRGGGGGAALAPSACRVGRRTSCVHTPLPRAETPQAAMVRDLAAAREAQMRSKLQLQSEVAAVERAEFDRVLAVNRQREAELSAQARALWGLQLRRTAAKGGGVRAMLAL